ncbi:MAG: GNAT family N-acetyltransferase [Oscillospiraceae bacterium]|nr:GNAT family N-acetyltransferase [Oscillospiraceae bacterium]
MFRAEPVTDGFRDLPRVTALMGRSFPANERMPLSTLLHRGGDASCFLAFYDGEEFCGFISLLTWRDITHILFFAMEETLRGKGYGSRALELVQERFAGQRIIADLEKEDGLAVNAGQRRSRKHFYLRHGYHESGISYRWREESYEILIRGGEISEAEFDEFWNQF